MFLKSLTVFSKARPKLISGLTELLKLSATLYIYNVYSRHLCGASSTKPPENRDLGTIVNKKTVTNLKKRDHFFFNFITY